MDLQANKRTDVTLKSSHIIFIGHCQPNEMIAITGITFVPTAASGNLARGLCFSDLCASAAIFSAHTAACVSAMYADRRLALLNTCIILSSSLLRVAISAQSPSAYMFGVSSTCTARVSSYPKDIKQNFHNCCFT
jgi:hypothetical protein